LAWPKKNYIYLAYSILLFKKFTTVNPNNINLNDVDRERHSKILETDLQLHVKVIAFKLVILYSESNILEVANSDVVADDRGGCAHWHGAAFGL
jgi:hypothetical protein